MNLHSISAAFVADLFPLQRETLKLSWISENIVFAVAGFMYCTQ